MPASLRELLLSIRGENRKIDSITQDIVTLCSDGKKRMPKHVGLAISLKNCLRSKEFITILNNLGHCISYDDVLRIDTTWATDIIKSNAGYATLPTNMRYGVFTQAASDNADFGQESNSQHVTNTVLYQRGEINTEQLRNKTPRKSIRRSLSIPSVPLEEFRSVAKPILPVNYSSIRLADIFIDQKSEAYQHSSSLTNAWILFRITGNKMFI